MMIIACPGSAFNGARHRMPHANRAPRTPRISDGAEKNQLFVVLPGEREREREVKTVSWHANVVERDFDTWHDLVVESGESLAEFG